MLYCFLDCPGRQCLIALGFFASPLDAKLVVVFKSVQAEPPVESQKLTNLLVDGDARELVPVRVDGDGGGRNLLLRRRRVHDLFNQSGGRLV